jgi:hypothetical protein
MKVFKLFIFLSILFVSLQTNVFGQTASQICGNGIVYTSCEPWRPIGHPQGTDGQIPAVINGVTTMVNDDTKRLNRLMSANANKIVFNEAMYYINSDLIVKPYQILEGTGLSPLVALPSSPVHLTSRIIQTATGKSIFKIGPSVNDVSIRDIAMIGGAGTTGTVGILAESSCLVNCSSIGFQFSNLKFQDLGKGIYVNAKDPRTISTAASSAHQWQFDNVRLDHSRFTNCKIGVHINSYNSGWNISSIDFLTPAGNPQGDFIPRPANDPASNDNNENPNIAGKTYGIYLERSTYTSMDLLIGNGPFSGVATALVYVQEHGNLSIQSSVSEVFYDDVIIHGDTRNAPINLMNNYFQGGVRVSRATVYSTGNQFYSSGNAQNPVNAVAEAKDSAQIYSFGDKFCYEGDPTCNEGRGYTTSGGARIINSSNQVKNSTEVPSFMKNYVNISKDNYIPTDTNALLSLNTYFSFSPLLRLDTRGFKYDFSRNETDGKLDIRGSQNGYAGYRFEMCQTCTGSVPEPVGTVISQVTINSNGSVTYGSVDYSALGLPANGTVVYCSTCTQTSTCAGGGSGALAKRINNTWQCN